MSYNWSSILKEADDIVAETKIPQMGMQHILELKSKLIQDLSSLTGRNTILYFSGYLDKQNSNTYINDKDINALMECVHKLDQGKGLDLILHTPGGDLAATEQIIYYLKSVFKSNIRAIIPQLAMSAGSMIAVSCNSIIMGRQSSLGPFDPQLNGVPCLSALQEFQTAIEDVEIHPSSLGLWQSILSKLTPTFLELCNQADKLSEELTDNILNDKKLSPEKIDSIKNLFAKNQKTKTHSRHIDRDQCKNVGLNIIDLEDNQEMQDLVLGIHHCCMILSEQTPILKILENNLGGGYMQHTTGFPQQPMC